MQSAMNRLSAFVRERRKLVLVAWVVLLVASVPFASRQTENLTSGGFEVPGTQSAEVDQAVDRFPDVSLEPLGVVLEPRGGDAAQMEAAVDRVQAAAAEADNVDLSDEAAGAARQAAEQEKVVLIPLDAAGSRDDALEAAEELREDLSVGEVEDGVQAYVVGQQALWAGLQEVQKEDLESAEMTGFPVILIVLLAVFGSVLAALLPVGLGIAAVVVSLAGLFLLDAAVMRSLAIGAIVVVVVAILGAVTLLPALIALLGRRADEPGRVVSATGLLVKRLTGRANRPPRTGPSFWERWTTRLMRRPVAFAVLGSTIMLVLAIPALSLDFGNGALAQFPETNETRRGAELAAALASPGESAPLLVLADFHQGEATSGDNQAALGRYIDQTAGTDGVERVGEPQISEDGRAALVSVVIDRDPESDA